MFLNHEKKIKKLKLLAEIMGQIQLIHQKHTPYQVTYDSKDHRIKFFSLTFFASSRESIELFFSIVPFYLVYLAHINTR